MRTSSVRTPQYIRREQRTTGSGVSSFPLSSRVGYGEETRRDPMSFSVDLIADRRQLFERELVGGRAHMEHEIDRRSSGKDSRTHDLPQTALETIAVDRGPPVLRHHQPGTWVSGVRKGSNYPNVEMFGAESLPCSCDLAKLGATRDAMTTRKSG